MFRAIALFSASAAFISCDNNGPEAEVRGQTEPSPSVDDLSQAQQIANAASIDQFGEAAGPVGSGDLSILGSAANQNQAAFRATFNLPQNPGQGQLAQWQAYNARLTEYSDQDVDWQSPTEALPNWQGTTYQGDPMALAGTTVAVDPSRIPPGSLLYIPSLNMYAEATDTGATRLWQTSDAGQSDYSSNGAGRIDIYNQAGGRSAGQVTTDFENFIGSNEYGTIYVVARGSGWKRNN